MILGTILGTFDIIGKLDNRRVESPPIYEYQKSFLRFFEAIINFIFSLHRKLKFHVVHNNDVQISGIMTQTITGSQGSGCTVVTRGHKKSQKLIRNGDRDGS